MLTAQTQRAIREESWDNLVCSEDFPCCFVVDGGVHLKSFNVSNHGSEEGDLQDRVMDRSGRAFIVHEANKKLTRL